MNVQSLLRGFLLRVLLMGVLASGSACVSAEKEKPKPAGEFIVISSAGKPNTDCKIIPKGNMYAAIYRKSFGPATYKECEDWMKKNCK